MIKVKIFFYKWLHILTHLQHLKNSVYTNEFYPSCYVDTNKGLFFYNNYA